MSVTKALRRRVATGAGGGLFLASLGWRAERGRRVAGVSHAQGENLAASPLERTHVLGVRLPVRIVHLGRQVHGVAVRVQQLIDQINEQRCALRIRSHVITTLRLVP